MHLIKIKSSKKWLKWMKKRDSLFRWTFCKTLKWNSDLKSKRKCLCKRKWGATKIKRKLNTRKCRLIWIANFTNCRMKWLKSLKLLLFSSTYKDLSKGSELHRLSLRAFSWGRIQCMQFSQRNCSRWTKIEEFIY